MEGQRLIAQAEYWRDTVILPGTSFERGSRLLEVGCGVGAVLGILGRSFPGLTLSGVDISAEQIGFARRNLADLGLPADLRVADALDLPHPDRSFDHVWMMWILEHMTEDAAVRALREAHRVLVPGGTITVIEADYTTVKFAPAGPDLRALWSGLVRAMRAFGQEDAGTQLWGWLDEAGFTGIEPGEQLFAYRGPAVAPTIGYLADVFDSVHDSLRALPDVVSATTLADGMRELRALADRPDARLRFVLHKARAVAQGVTGPGPR